MRVCFLRHGPAVPRGSEGTADDERPLTPEGRARTRLAAQGIARLELAVDEVWTSPLPRARETAAILARVLGLPAPLETDLLRPEVPAGRLLAILRQAKGRCPVLVGHEPALGAAVARLVGGRAGAFPLKKAGLAVVDLERPATLLFFLPPSALRRLGR